MLSPRVHVGILFIWSSVSAQLPALPCRCPDTPVLCPRANTHLLQGPSWGGRWGEQAKWHPTAFLCRDTNPFFVLISSLSNIGLNSSLFYILRHFPLFVVYEEAPMLAWIAVGGWELNDGHRILTHTYMCTNVQFLWNGWTHDFIPSDTSVSPVTCFSSERWATGRWPH